MNSSQRKRKRKVWIWSGITLGILLIFIIGAVVVVEGHGKAIAASRLAKVKRGDIIKSVVATGPVHPITQVEVKSKASGLVEQLYVKPGEYVTKGQKLAQLDQQEIRAQVSAQKADLAGAEANVTTAKANVAEDRVNASAPELPMYRQTYQRNKTMFHEGLVSQQTYDNAQRDYLAALNKRNVARAQITVDEARLKQAEAQKQQAIAGLAQLQEQLSYTTLVAPINGVVLSRDVQVGDAVSSILVLGSNATKVMTIGNIDKDQGRVVVAACEDQRPAAVRDSAPRRPGSCASARTDASWMSAGCSGPSSRSSAVPASG